MERKSMEDAMLELSRAIRDLRKSVDRLRGERITAQMYGEKALIDLEDLPSFLKQQAE
jgi:hypothetical protein